MAALGALLVDLRARERERDENTTATHQASTLHEEGRERGGVQ
jgi:hypothetical protein